MLETNETPSSSLFNNLPLLTSLEALILLKAHSFVNMAVKKWIQKAPQAYLRGTLIGRTVHLVTRALRFLFSEASLCWMSIAISVHVIRWEASSIFRFVKKAWCISSVWQKRKLQNVESLLKQMKKINELLFGMHDAADEVLLYLTYFMFNQLQFITLSYEWYSVADKRRELEKLLTQEDKLLPVLRDLLEYIILVWSLSVWRLRLLKLSLLIRTGNRPMHRSDLDSQSVWLVQMAL